MAGFTHLRTRPGYPPSPATTPRGTFPSVDRIRREILPLAWADPAMRRALAARDMTEVYRRLIAAGLNQRQISQLTGQRPSEVSEVVNGRRVQAIAVLERIAAGLDIEPGWMGLAYTGGRSRSEGHPADVPPDAQEVTEDVKRRNFLNAAAGTVVWGHPVLAEILTSAQTPPTPMPRSISGSDVAALRDLTEGMRGLARHYGGQAETISTVAHRYTELMTVSGTKQVKADLGSALAALHTMAGWTAFDSGAAPDAVRGHFSQALDLAADAGDHYLASDALYHSGGITEENGHPNDALKLFQLAQMRLADAPRADPRVPVLAGWLRVESASALVHLGRPDLARTELAASRSEWDPPSATERADMDWLTALVERDLGRLDVAEQFAASSIRHWSRTENRRDAVLARITLAELHLAAREPSGLRLAEQAVDGVAELPSVRARARLAPLAATLAGQRDSTAHDLARRARAVAVA